MRRLFLLLVLAFAPAVFPFGMAVDENGFVNLGNLEPGQSEFDGGFNYNNITVVSLNVNPASSWSLDIEANDFAGPIPMPLSSLIWQVAYKVDSIPTSPWYKDPSYPAFPNDIRHAFSAANSPYTVVNALGGLSPSGPETGTHLIGFLFHINIPSNQQSGTYFTNVKFTLTQ